MILYSGDIGRSGRSLLRYLLCRLRSCSCGMSDKISRKAAKALVDYVRQAEAIDYAYKAYCLDGPTALEFGIRDGTPYYNETELRLSEKEFRELYARLL